MDLATPVQHVVVFRIGRLYLQEAIEMSANLNSEQYKNLSSCVTLTGNLNTSDLLELKGNSLPSRFPIDWLGIKYHWRPQPGFSIALGLLSHHTLVGMKKMVRAPVDPGVLSRIGPETIISLTARLLTNI